MKLKRVRSLRGSIQSTGDNIKQQLIIDDGLINNGMKIISFDMWTTSGNSENTVGIDANLSLAQMPNHAATMDASDNRQIAWTTGGFDNAILTMTYRTFIDPNHVVNRDLFIHAEATPNLWNYLIIYEEYELSDDEAIVQIIKETSQNTDPD
jgi:hypothetical protein